MKSAGSSKRVKDVTESCPEKIVRAEELVMSKNNKIFYE